MANEHQIKPPCSTPENHPEKTHQLAYTEPQPPPRTTAINWLSPVLKHQTGADSFVFQSWQGHPREIRPLRGKGSCTPEARLKFPKRGEIGDIDGILWDVRDIRPTKHGFDIYYGTPAFHSCGSLSRKPRLIATSHLVEFWDANCTRGHGFLFDLPAGRTTLKRLRARLGFNFHDDTDAFWKDRIDDLRSLSGKEFAARHGVSRDLAVDWRCRFFGSTRRTSGWWRKPKVMAALLSGQTLCKIGRKLGISVSQVFRLRARARQESQEANNRVNPGLVSFRTFFETAKTGDYEPPLAA
jgi:hypothetical protein